MEYIFSNSSEHGTVKVLSKDELIEELGYVSYRHSKFLGRKSETASKLLAINKSEKGKLQGFIDQELSTNNHCCFSISKSYPDLQYSVFFKEYEDDDAVSDYINAHTWFNGNNRHLIEQAIMAKLNINELAVGDVIILRDGNKRRVTKINEHGFRAEKLHRCNAMLFVDGSTVNLGYFGEQYSSESLNKSNTNERINFKFFNKNERAKNNMLDINLIINIWHL